MTKIVSVVALSVLKVGCSVFGIRSEEGPRYEVIAKDGNKEIRKYSGYLTATTWVEGGFKESQNKGFQILADYIFGANGSNSKIAMTAPVIQVPSNEKTSGERIAMTAPVTSQSVGSGWRMSFMMPSKFTMQTLPTPNDPRVEILEVPSRVVAAIRFSGSWSEVKNNKKAEELRSWISTRPDYIPASDPEFAGYNPPWTLPIFRRNEILIPLSPNP